MVIRPGHPDPAGFPLTGEICLRPDCMWHCGSDFLRITVPQGPFCPKSNVTAQLTVGINRENLLMKPVSGRRQCALAPTVAADQVPRSPLPATRRLMSTLYTFDARDVVATCCVDT